MSQFVNDDFSFDQQQHKQIDIVFEALGHKNKSTFNHYKKISDTRKTPNYTINRIEKLKNRILLNLVFQIIINYSIYKS